jgi:hypothetical protein
MKYIEEAHALDLRQSFVELFEQNGSYTAVRVEGGGVHWKCLVEGNSSICSIHCFDYQGTPEYYAEFSRQSVCQARSRSRSKQETMAAVAEWMDGSDLRSIYEHHPIVDQRKRALLRIQDELMSMQTEGAKVEYALNQWMTSDSYKLHLHAHQRSCLVSYWGDNKQPDAEFSWDDCPLFKFRIDDVPFLGLAVIRWVTEAAMPSTMRKEFPGLDIGPLADYYENGNPIEGEFIASWDRWERSCRELPDKTQPLARAFIAAMRRKGYDRKLRAGRSMFTFILSRSRRHGVRLNQSSIGFSFDRKGMRYGATLEGSATEFRQPSILLTPEIERLLDLLAAEPID